MKGLKGINTGALAAVVTVNALANLLPIGGRTTGQVAESMTNLFTPAPLTFAIWGVIYAMMIGFVLYQWGLFDGGLFSDRVRESIGLWFAVSCLANIGWILSWHLGAIGLSVAFMAALLLSLIMIEESLKDLEGRAFGRIMAKAGFDIYFGWIIAASIANVSAYLTKIGWNGWGFSAEVWTVIMLLVGAIIAAAVVMLRQNRLAGASVIWAYVGILIRHFADGGFARVYPFVIAAAFIGLLIVLDAIAIVSLNGYFRFEKYCEARA